MGKFWFGFAGVVVLDVEEPDVDCESGVARVVDVGRTLDEDFPAEVGVSLAVLVELRLGPEARLDDGLAWGEEETLVDGLADMPLVVVELLDPRLEEELGDGEEDAFVDGLAAGRLGVAETPLELAPDVATLLAEGFGEGELERLVG